MCGEKGERETKRLVLRTCAKKFERIVVIFLRHMNAFPIGIFHPMGARIRAPKVKIFLRKWTIVPLADVTDVISVRP